MDITASEVTQDFLLDEYAREMIGEWNRWMTLKRFRAFESLITKANPQITKFDKNIHDLRPIPTDVYKRQEHGTIVHQKISCHTFCHQ